MMQAVHPFFIVGAPRCGTTAMARYLGKHPNICFSKPKETHYFLFPRKVSEPDALRQEFLAAYFPHLSDSTKTVGEGSVSTLYSTEAIERIMRCFEQPKFIVMLRDPVEMMRSYHARLLHLRQEDEPDFPKAWALQDRRASGQNIPRGCQDPRMLLYSEIGRLGHYSTKLIEQVGPDNCLPVFFDDFREDTLATYKRALAFLEIEYDGRVEFRRTNPTRNYKSGLLQSLYTGPLMRPVASQLLKNPVRAAQIQRALKRLRKKVKRINAVEAEPPKLDPQFAAHLRAHFEDDVAMLGRTFKKDLTHWTTATGDVQRTQSV